MLACKGLEVLAVVVAWAGCVGRAAFEGCVGTAAFEGYVGRVAFVNLEDRAVLLVGLLEDWLDRSAFVVCNLYSTYKNTIPFTFPSVRTIILTYPRPF